jgi:D-glycero-alpha-D-manno-heptose-7-phosphate kinase
MNEKIRARAPLRLGLAGGGTDVSPYCNDYGGYVLNAAISLYAYATIEPAPPGKVIFRATDLGEEIILDADPDMSLKGPLQLHRGVYRRFIREFNNGQPLDIILSTHSDAPPGSGLGSSSTVVVAMVEALQKRLKLSLDEYEIARLAFEIERRDLKLNGGRQDQYAATFGGVNFMEFYDDQKVVVNPLRVQETIMAELEASLVLYFTGVSRDSAAIIDEQTRGVENGASRSLDAMHTLKEDAVQMKQKLLRGDIRGIATLLGHSWQTKKQLSELIANPAIDRVYDIAVKAGAYSGKISGAGGGGFMMFLVDPARRPEVCRALSREGGKVQTAHFASERAIAWRCS